MILSQEQIVDLKFKDSLTSETYVLGVCQAKEEASAAT